MSFEEFCGHAEKHVWPTPYATRMRTPPDQAFALHDRAMQLVHEYELIGGMHGKSSRHTSPMMPRHRRNGILRATSSRKSTWHISADMAKYATPTETPRIMAVWNSIPQQLAKENHKFQYKLIKSGGRAAIYENAIAWLDAAGIIMRCTQVTEATAPLKTFENSSSFKIYTADVGLLSAQYEAIPQDLEPATDKAAGFREHHRELCAAAARRLGFIRILLGYYQQSRGRIIAPRQTRRRHPHRVKSGRNVTARSLESFRERYHPPYLVRVSARNFGVGNGIRSIPLYAAWLLGEDLQ